MNIINTRYLENAWMISKKFHQGQEYGRGQDYFAVHIMDALDRASKKAYQLRLDQDTTKKIQICTLLHDVIEDTNIDRSYLVDKVGAENAQYAYILSNKELDGTKKDKNKYFGGIGKYIVTKVTKFGDRKSNMIATYDNFQKHLIDNDKVEYFIKKYMDDMPYRYSNDIYPGHMSAIIDKVKGKIISI